MHIHTIRTALRLSTAAALISLAACGDNSLSGVEDASIARGSGQNAAPAATGASGGGTSGGGTRGGEVKTIIALSPPAGAPFASAKGKAKFASQGGERELEIEAENIPTGTVVSFLLDGAVIGTATSDALREVNLNLNSDRGASVPLSVTGKSVRVQTAAGAVIVSGSF